MGTSAPRPGIQRVTAAVGPYLVVALATVLVNSFVLAGWCAAFLPDGVLPAALAYHVSLSANLLLAVLVYGSTALVWVAAVSVAALLALRRRTWARRALPWALALLVATGLTIPLFGIGQAVYWSVHHNAVRATPARATGLVDAIKRYQQEHGAPPPTLEALLPDYLTEIPGTGLAGFPRFEYRPLADDDWYKGRYELFVRCPWSYAGPSALVYWPEENGYLVSWPEDAAWRWDGGDWVYVNMR